MSEKKSINRQDILSNMVIGAALEVHKVLGPGLLESAYEECLCHEFSLQKLSFERQKHLPVEYKGVKLDCGYRLDILVEKSVVLEIKTVDKILPVHEAQLLTYLKLTGLHLGMLINFHEHMLRNGIKRIVNQLPEQKSISPQ